MTERSPRWPCPACLGVMMEKASFGENEPLTVDHCSRCGGVWFELGEVQRLRSRSAEELWTKIPPRATPELARCHACHAHISSNAERCPACGDQVKLLCPPCQHPMERATRDGLTLDVCRRCKGVWFDHHELSAIWTLELGQSLASSRGQAVGHADASLVLLDSLMWSPHLLFYGAHGVTHALAASAEAVAHTPEALGTAVEIAGEAAESVFEAILELVSGFFS
jgi:Zn-finger nucleic acid-binding protein